MLVLGAGGLLGGAFREGGDGAVSTASARDHAATVALIATRRPAVVVNCAADTDVEGAERDPTASMAANARLPGLLAEACARAGAVLVHVSSTGCYGTGSSTPYGEDDEPEPTTTHHAHKVEGERRVRSAGCEALILRTGWLFGGRPGQAKNFVWNRIVEARAKPRIQSDPFQTGNPTYVGDVVRQCHLLLEKGVRGTFNCVSSPAVTRLDYVRAIVAAAGLPCVVAASDAPFERLARVSPNEAAENRRLGATGLDIMRPWTQTLPPFVASLLAIDARAHNEDRP